MTPSCISSARFAHIEHDAALRYTTRHKRQLVFLDDGVTDKPVAPATGSTAVVSWRTPEALHAV